jgi:hypothetical protein
VGRSVGQIIDSVGMGLKKSNEMLAKIIGEHRERLDALQKPQ